jgi:hypothetical protein
MGVLFSVAAGIDVHRDTLGMRLVHEPRRSRRGRAGGLQLVGKVDDVRELRA